MIILIRKPHETQIASTVGCTKLIVAGLSARRETTKEQYLSLSRVEPIWQPLVADLMFELPVREHMWHLHAMQLV